MCMGGDLRTSSSPICKDEAAMRWDYLIVIVPFAVATILFCIQNLEVVTMSFLGFSVRAPLATRRLRRTAVELSHLR